ncbi:DEAD/DEAH box helicase [Candidatus Nitrospira salsa]
MSRPFFNKSISDLEIAYQNNLADPAFCQKLLYELTHRSTKRAQNLKNKIVARNEVPREVTPRKLPKKSAEALEMPNEDEVIPIVVEEPQVYMPPPKVEVGPKPAITNDPQNILRSWTALEVLSTQAYRRETDLVAGDKYKIAQLDEKQLPWERGEKSRKNKRLYYELILGAVVLSPAVESLLKVYADKRPDQPSVGGYSPVASILIDKEGRPLDEDSTFAISSFAWGVPIALKGDLKALADWPDHERALKEALKKPLVKKDHQGDILPLNKTRISELFEVLVKIMDLGALELKPPYFAIRRYEFFASKTPPEPGLLNSFFMQDLATARELAKEGRLPNALKHYLSVEKPARKTDLLKDDVGLQDLLQPALTSVGRWPGNGRFPLALLQQASVNATHPSRMKTGVLAVNGPPGTGKTTLLRDVVAARIIERAIVMSSYQKPADAFTSTSQTLQRSGAKITLHKLDDRLKGFEMIVTSSNNKAVENVSAELPALDAIADDAPELRYFKAISDNVLDRKTWGTIAAVLGNSSNRYTFSESFWRDDENGLSAYLNHVSGIPQIVSEPQEGGAPIRRNRKIIDSENPPSNPREASARWEKARSQFLQAQRLSAEKQEELQHIHVQIVRLVSVAGEINDLVSQQPLLAEEFILLEEQLGLAQAPVQGTETLQVSTRQSKDTHAASRPGFFSRIFQRRRYHQWLSEQQAFEKTTQQAERAFEKAKKGYDDLHTLLTTKKKQIEQLKTKIVTLEQEQVQLKAETKNLKEDLGASIPDADFFAMPHEEMQISSVWLDAAASRMRDDVFEAAMKLHRAFIDCAADPLRQNLSIFIESFGTRSLGTLQKDSLIADLWASFFLVVPVVSTTFASVHRMFSRLAPEALGWLLVDEAGQAVPQACVGAMIRTKHSVVVGDPLQIEPVVTLPNSLTEEVCAFFGIDPFKYNAPEASVQTVADAASTYCAQFPIGSGHRNVGAPLLVHRRCNNPMFDISNEIAYSNLMVQAKKSSPINPILGPSSWVDIVGKPGPDKWCAVEAVVLIEMLRKLKDGGAEPDLYVVTPFVIVQDNLRREILNSRVLDNWVGNANSWVWEHVGTVHTVQGREAGIVFIVLGAQMSSQNGARTWAGGRPNLVNVAVTRAKDSMYVIGNRDLWKSAGVFATLDRYLPDAANDRDFQ